MTDCSPRPVLLLFLSLALVVSAGCLGFVGQEDLPDGETVSESLRSIDAVEANATMEVVIENESTAFTMDFVERAGTGEFRATMRPESSDDRLLLVSNGTVAWVHNRSSDVVTELRLHDQSAQWNQSVETISTMFDSLKASSSDEDVSISTLPSVPGGGGGAVGAAGAASMPAAGNVSLTYEGTETLANREAHVVDLTPATNESLIENGSIWYDTQRYYPIRANYDMVVAGQSVSVTLAYENITYDPDVADDVFTYEPPENATIETSQSIATAQTRAGLVGETELSVPDPDLPSGYQFARGTTTTVDGDRALTMQYATRTDALAISKGPPTDDEGQADGETIDVASNEATYVTDGEQASVTWRCDGSEYTVSGSLSKSQLRSVAASIACE